MFAAHELKQKNMAEYLLYMWRVEDIIRAFDADIEKIDTQLIAGMNLTEEQRKAEYEWYESLIDMMRREGCLQKGHIQLVKNALIDLEDIHLSLLQTAEGVEYKAKYYQLQPSLTILKSKSSDPTLSDLEMCFVFLYCMMNLRQEKAAISEDTERTAKQAAGLLAMLSRAYAIAKEENQ